MKNTSLLLLFFISLHLISCNVDGSNEDECAAVLCVGPAVLAFEIQDSMGNIFTTGSFSLADVSFSGDIASDLEAVLGGGSGSTLFIGNRNWIEGPSSFEINLPGHESILVQVEIDNSEGDCCGGIPLLASASVNGTTQELNGTPFTVTLVPN